MAEKEKVPWLVPEHKEVWDSGLGNVSTSKREKQSSGCELCKGSKRLPVRMESE